MNASRSPRALLAWEFGAGRTHLLHLLGVARHLREANVEVLAAVYEPSMRDAFAEIGVPVVQNYVWPGRRRLAAGWRESEIRGFGDVFVNLGMVLPGALGAALHHYDGLFSIFEPDLVLAENAPGALLAARGHVPAIAFGTNGTLPPVRDGRFALRPGVTDGGPVFHEDEVRDAFNGELAASGRAPLAALTDLLPQGLVYPFGPPAFDTYGAVRREPALSPYIPDFQLPERCDRGAGVFAYLHAMAQGSESLLDGLSGSGRTTVLHFPGILPAMRERLGAGLTISEAPLPLPWILSGPRCVVHHGGLQLTTACLAAGRPQVILAKELDNEIAGRFVVDRGLGFARHITRADGHWLRSTIRAAHDDDALWTRCRRQAPEFRRWIETDPTRTVADAALEILARR